MSFFNDLFNTKNREEICELVDKRLIELNKQYNKEVTIGQNYTSMFDGFISDTTHYKSGEKFGDKDIPDLSFDDKAIYYDFVERITKILPKYKEKEPSDVFVSVASIATDVITAHLKREGDNADCEREKYCIFIGKTSGNGEGKVSITEMINGKCCTCAEMAGQAQNLMHLVGISCSLVAGTVQEQPHAYNLLHIPYNGGIKHFIFDSTKKLVCNNGIVVPFIAGLIDVEYNNLLKYEQIDIAANKDRRFSGEVKPILDGVATKYGMTEYKKTKEDVDTPLCSC